MKKLYCFILLLLAGFSTQAQLKYEATGDYGKIWDIKYDQYVPNKLYALTLINHLMVSEDNGITWNILYAYPNSGAYLTNLKIAPGGHALTFVVRGEYNLQNNGVYVYDLASNAISSHYTPPNWADNPAVMSYSIYNSTGNVALIYTSYSIDFSPYSKVFYTTDAGVNWSEVYFSGSNNDVQVNSVAISPGDPAKLFIGRSLGSAGVNGGLFVSTDAGVNFTDALPGIAIDPITFNPDHTDTMWAGSAISFGATPENLYRSIDGGTTWSTIPITWNDQTLNNITTIAYDPVNTNIMWLFDENEYARSTDGGTTWTNTAYPPDDITYSYGTNITINPFNNSQLFINSDAFPQYSSDGGATLTQAKNPFCDIYHLGLANYPGTKHLYYATLGGYLDKDLATGTTPAYSVGSPFIFNAPTRVPIADSTVPGRVFIYTPGNGFNSATLQLSNDYGATLTNLPVDEFTREIPALKKDPNNPNIYWIAYLASFDLTGNLYKLDMSDLNNVIATMVTTPTGEAVSGIYMDPFDSNTMYISQGVKVFKSTDAGINWIEKSTGLGSLIAGDDFIHDMENNALNNNQFVLATTRGLYISNDGAETWSLSAAGYNLEKAAFSPVAYGHIIASSKSTQQSQTELIYSTNSGASWQNISPAALQYLQTRNADFDFYNDHIDIYFSSVDLGVVKYTISNLPFTAPFQLISFTGSVNGDAANLVWVTTNEQHLLKYELERSIDGTNFEKINTQPGTNTPGDHTYTYADGMFDVLAEQYPVIYYRLKMIDASGSYTYSWIVTLSSRTVFSIYPSPVQNTLNLHVQTLAAGKYFIGVIDAIGRVYVRNTYNIQQGNTLISIPFDAMAKGTYILTIEDGNGKKTALKFVKN